MKQFNFETQKIEDIEDIPLYKWLKPYQLLLNWGFTEKEITDAIIQSDNTLGSLTDRNGYQNINIFSHWKSPYDILKTNHYFTIKEYKGEFSKDVRVNDFEVRVPGQYQGLKHGEILFKLFSNKYTWFSSFLIDKSYKESEIELDIFGRLDIKKLTDEQKNLSINEILELSEKKDIIKKKSAWDIYELHDYNNSFNEMYLQTESGSLYVPYEAIINKDFSIIEKRMKDYWSKYNDHSGFNLNH